MAPRQVKPRCGLCRKTNKESIEANGCPLTITDCCKKWICDDEHTYGDHSYGRYRVSCMRNHYRYSLCFFHFNEGHTGRQGSCKECKSQFDQDDYKNDFSVNFRRDRPKAKVKCENCTFVTDDLSQMSGGIFTDGDIKYYCEKRNCVMAAKNSEKSAKEKASAASAKASSEA